MKMVLSVRSNVAYSLLTKLIGRESSLPDFEFQNRSTIQQLEDAIEFYKADVYIVDKQMEDAESMINVLEQWTCDYIAIEDDVKAVIPILIERFGIVQEEEKQPVQIKGEEKERVVIQEKIIEKEVIRTAYQAIPSKVVVIGSLYRGAGSTLLATNLARMIARRGIDVAYVEHPLIKPYMYDYLQIHRHMEDKPYIDVAREIQSDGIARSKKDAWIQDDVKWSVIDSGKSALPSFSYENLLVLSHSVQSSVLIIDISDRWLDPEVQKFLYVADNVIICVEPDPIKYDWSLYALDKRETKERMIMDFLTTNEQIDFDMVLMKNVKGIDVKTVKEMLHKKPIAQLPYIHYQDIQKSLFQSKILYDFESYSDVFERELMTLISKVIPKDFVELKPNEKKGLGKWLNIGKNK